MQVFFDVNPIFMREKTNKKLVVSPTHSKSLKSLIILCVKQSKLQKNYLFKDHPCKVKILLSGHKC